MIFIKSVIENADSKYAQIIIGQNNEARLWSVGGLPGEGDLQAILDTRFAELWREAQNGELIDFRAFAFSYLNQWRGLCRSGFGLTSTQFQELCYTGKALECTRWKSNQVSPFGLASEAIARGISNEQMADLVLEQWLAWQQASDSVEATYISYKQAIETATSIEEISQLLGELTNQ